MGSGKEQRDFELKGHHHVKLDVESKLDCEVWLQFLTDDKVARVINHPMIDILGPAQSAEKIGFASGSKKSGGYGCVLNMQWMRGKWDPTFLKECEPSIEYVELYALVVAVEIWAQSLRNRRVGIFCDNQSVVHMVNNSTSSCGRCMILIRILVLKQLEFNFRLAVRHVRSAKNEVADCLSHLKLQHFHKVLRPKFHLRAVPEPLPMTLWPVTKVWNTGF